MASSEAVNTKESLSSEVSRIEDSLEQQRLADIIEDVVSDGSSEESEEVNLQQCPHCEEQFAFSYINLHVKWEHRDKFSANEEELKKIVELETELLDLVSIEKEDSNSTDEDLTPALCTHCNHHPHFPDEASLRFHTLLRHPEELGLSRCDKCGLLFITKESFLHQKAVHERRRKFRCKKCGDAFLYIKSLRAHIRKSGHVPDPPLIHQRDLRVNMVFRCGECKKYYITKEELDKHRSKMHRDDCKCNICGNTFSSKSRLLSHMTMKHPEEKTILKCRVCNKEHTEYQNHYRHLRNRHGFKCPYCERWYYDQRFLYRHILRDHADHYDPEVKYVCSFCKDNEEKFVGTRRGWIDHVRSLHPEAFPYYCYKCDRYYQKKENLDDHTCTLLRRTRHRPTSRDLEMIYELEDAPDDENQDSASLEHPQNYIACHICGTFSTSCHLDLDQHIVSHHCELYCFLCGEMFTWTVELDDHFLQNHEHICRVCKIVFKTKGDLNEHFDNHTEDERNEDKKIYECNYANCGESFDAEEDVIYYRHLQQHEELTCHRCNKSFNTVDEFKKDSVDHQNEIIFPCDVCDETYKTNAAWKQHKITHMYRCEWAGCGQLFVSSSKLRKHTLSVHVPYYCKICSELFDRKRDLKAHECPRKRKTYKCKKSRCNRIFETENELNNHDKTDHAFLCPTCSVVFDRRGALGRHILCDHPRPSTSSELQTKGKRKRESDICGESSETKQPRIMEKKSAVDVPAHEQLTTSVGSGSARKKNKQTPPFQGKVVESLQGPTGGQELEPQSRTSEQPFTSPESAFSYKRKIQKSDLTKSGEGHKIAQQQIPERELQLQATARQQGNRNQVLSRREKKIESEGSPKTALTVLKPQFQAPVHSSPILSHRKKMLEPSKSGEISEIVQQHRIPQRLSPLASTHEQQSTSAKSGAAHKERKRQSDSSQFEEGLKTFDEYVTRQQFSSPVFSYKKKRFIPGGESLHGHAARQGTGLNVPTHRQPFTPQGRSNTDSALLLRTNPSPPTQGPFQPPRPRQRLPLGHRVPTSTLSRQPTAHVRFPFNIWPRVVPSHPPRFPGPRAPGSTHRRRSK